MRYFIANYLDLHYDYALKNYRPYMSVCEVLHTFIRLPMSVKLVETAIHAFRKLSTPITFCFTNKSISKCQWELNAFDKDIATGSLLLIYRQKQYEIYNENDGN